MTKFEFVDNNIYFVISLYIKVDNKEYMLEMVTELNDETLFGAYGKNEFIKTIEEYNRKLYIDSLTGAYNRYYYDEQLKKSLRVSAVAMMDVDNFKEINDTFGHAVGDEVLKEIVKTISSFIRPVDTVVRMGGDEFLLTFQNISKEALENRLENIRQGVSTIVLAKHPELKVSVSIGAVYDEISAAEKSELADKCLYKAKINKNALVVCQE
ncbi:MAG: GGDEF domain-containing protein [Synergistaceae bacterium]|nr:GGDEF domain-containing protein [Synergistaceae bacterium]